MVGTVLKLKYEIGSSAMFFYIKGKDRAIAVTGQFLFCTWKYNNSYRYDEKLISLN